LAEERLHGRVARELREDHDAERPLPLVDLEVRVVDDPDAGVLLRVDEAEPLSDLEPRLPRRRAGLLRLGRRRSDDQVALLRRVEAEDRARRLGRLREGLPRPVIELLRAARDAEPAAAARDVLELEPEARVHL